MMESRTYIAVPPGATIREMLDDRGMTQKEFAARMDLSQKHVSKLVNGEVQLTPIVARRLEMVLGVPSNFWNSLEARYRDMLVKAAEENEMDEDVDLVKLFPYQEMSRYGWIQETGKRVERVINLRQFFEVSRLSLVFKGLVPPVAYRKTSDKDDAALWAWAQKARLDARETSVGRINIDKLVESLPSIRSMTMQEPSEFCSKLAETLAGCGVAIEYLPHLAGTGVHGASFYDGRKIVCAMTVRGKDADRFWFSLFHELGHIVRGHLASQDGTTDEQEREADAFAQDWLIPPDDLERFELAGDFSEKSVRSFAEAVGVAPGIVVGRLQNDRKLRYNQLSHLKEKYALTERNP